MDSSLWGNNHTLNSKIARGGISEALCSGLTQLSHTQKREKIKQRNSVTLTQAVWPELITPEDPTLPSSFASLCLNNNNDRIKYHSNTIGYQKYSSYTGLYVAGFHKWEPRDFLCSYSYFAGISFYSHMLDTHSFLKHIGTRKILNDWTLLSVFKNKNTTQDHNICLFVPQDTALPPVHIPLQITSKNCPKGTSQSRTVYVKRTSK